ncbi:M20/M25/M40 family metallo-hydrolase [Microbacterium sp. M3]|uniref:M20/M25/M40 family metallo-hydrolase n=1 Tax=Microbacterium arthrosphaerae TaxID=792652 RepID=A0ABU4H128_9MICO|nr:MULTISPECIES: M20/M25/M40 family metallo-hydrolase [Microbacterium]MDW4572970.1 M20/M25/M40 family metallo-hydrolase [Microbacterium arthrosphaerae]MDW7606825.1 M20/M25/M40 family metallo-hydrolase [Microbacterium sp. M3]
MPEPGGQTAARPGIAERLSRMIQLPTVSAERAERGQAPFEAFAQLLVELYPLVHEHLEFERIGELGLLYRWRGRRSEEPVVLMAHFDVVPVDESDAWSHPPFDGRVERGWVYGRGALDDKGPLVVVMDAVENLLAAGFIPARDVYLSFGGDEETFGGAARIIAETLRDRGIEPWLVLDEGGAVVEAPLPFVRGRAAMVGVGEKGVLTLRLSARGEGGHASAPPARTAVRRIARAVERLSPRTFPARTPAAVSRMLELFATRADGIPRRLYQMLSTTPWLTARVFTAMGGEPAALVRTTVAATMQSGGTAANVLPSQASATLNLRIALGESLDGTVRRVRRRIADRRVLVEVLEGDGPSPESPTDNAQFALIAHAVAVSHPDAATVPYVMMAATDSRHFHRFSPAVYRFAPLEMSKAQRASIHGVDERVEVAALERGELFHRTLLQRLE